MVLFFNPYIFASTIVQNLPYVTDNLIAYWEQSGYSAGTINVADLSGQSHPVQYSVSTPSTVTSTSVSSNANTSLTNDTYKLNFSQGLTYEVLFTLASVANGQDPTIMFWDPYSTGGGQMMNISATNLVPYMYNANINQGYVYPGNAQLNTGQWYHVMFTSTPQGLWNFYLDGYPTASGTGFVMPVTPQSNYNFGVGNPSPFVNQYQTTTSCLAFWDFGDTLSYSGTGTSINSLSYTATTGTISGSKTFGNSALTLTSTSSSVANSSVTLNMASTGATFETIFNPSTLTGNIMSFSSSSGVVSFGLSLNATSNIQMIVNSVSANTLPITVTSGVWYHLAVSLTGGGAFSYYIDGLLVTSGQLAQTLPSNLIQSFGLGAPPTQATGFTGSFAMARVYNYALTPAQVIRNYQAVLSKFSNNPYNLPANTANTYTTSSNLLGYWDFTKTCSYTSGQTFVNDLSGSSRALNIVSTVLPTYTSNGYNSITAGTNFGANVSTLVNYSSLMTAECMFCTGSVSATVQPIIYNTAATTNGFNLKVNQTSSGGFTITGPNATTYYASSNVNVQSTTWYHMLATLDKTRTLYLYINGTLASSFNNVVLTDPGSTPMGFGTTDTGTGYKLALGRVYNIPLTPNQIWNNYVSSYNSGVFSNTATTYVTNGLSGYWDFANYSPGSSILQDLSPNGKPLTLSGVTYKNVNGAISGSYVTSGSATNTAFTMNTAAGFTMETLFYSSNTLAPQDLIDFYGGVNNSVYLGLSGSSTSNTVTYVSTHGSDPYFSNVALLLHGDGNFFDYSPLGAAMTSVGIVNDSIVYKFGTGSIKSPTDGASNYLQTPTNANYIFGARFTFEFWVNPISLPTGTNQRRVAVTTTGGQIYLNGTIVGWTFGAGQSTSIGYPTIGQWSHMAFCYDGTTQYIFINGILAGSAIYTTPPSTTSSNIRCPGSFDAGNDSLAAYFDEIRFTQNVCRYTSNFTIPTSAFPNSVGFLNNYILEYPPSGINATITSNTVSQTMTRYATTSNTLTSNTSSITYGVGTYTVACSSNTFTQSVNLAFNKNTLGNDRWDPYSANYTAGAGVYGGTVTTTVSSVSQPGEWIQLKLPNPIVPTSIIIYPFTNGVTRAPSSFVFAGSNDGTTWTSILDRTGQTSWVYTGTGNPYTIITTSSYTYYRLIARAVQPSTADGWLSISELRVFGTELPSREYPPNTLTGSSTLLTGQAYGNGTYIVTSSPITSGYDGWHMFDNGNTTNTDWAQSSVYYTTTSYSGPATTTVSGSATPGDWVQIQLPLPIILTSYKVVTTHATWSATQWVLAGSNDGTTWTRLDSQTGQPIGVKTITYSVPNTAAYNRYIIIVQRNSNVGTDFCTISDLYLYSDPYAISSNNVVTNNTWTHTALSVTSSNVYQMYINGVALPPTPNVALSLGGTTTQTLALGSRGGTFPTSNIAMARIYSTPLNSGQIQQNYYSAFNKLYGNPYALTPNPSLSSAMYSFPAYPPASNLQVTSARTYLNGYSYGNGSYIATSSSGSDVSATGGTKTIINVNGINYYLHTFTTTGTSSFVVTGGSLTCDILVVAGGGSGGTGYSGSPGGGGGAGGLLTFTAQTVTGTNTVTVGAGAPVGGGANGNDSQFGALTLVKGGGAGGGAQGSGGGNGGIGGSGGGGVQGNVGAAGTFGQGNTGGGSIGLYGGGGGGGGAGTVGGTGGTGNGGNGGNGLPNSITGTTVYYAGGGAGQGYSGYIGGTGGLGGGGSGTTWGTGTGGSGTPNTGSGGGGGPTSNGGAGGSGIVIVRYAV